MKNKFVPFEKLSKKEQKERNKQKRGAWGEVKPITKIVPSKKVYNRKKVGKDFPAFFIKKLLTNI